MSKEEGVVGMSCAELSKDEGVLVYELAELSREERVLGMSWQNCLEKRA